MRPVRLLAASLLATTSFGLAAQNAPAPPIQPQISAGRPDWENPSVFARGKEPARATGFPFESRTRAMTYRFRLTSFAGNGTNAPLAKPANAGALQ